MSSNAELAHLFHEIADLLDLGGANAFRVNAHRKVARLLEDSADDLASMARTAPEQLRALPGVGEASARKIEEFLTTGKVQEREELLASIPAGLLEVLRVQGLGPKRVRTLWQEGGVDGMPALRAKLADGSLLGLPGMGAKTLQNIAESLAFLETTRGRIRLGEALPLAETMVAHLRGVAGLHRIEIAGSLRRGRETIGDIDLLASAEDPSLLHAAMRTAPGVGAVLASGATKTSVRTDFGIQVDLRTVDDAQFGAALLYFTGSKEHNVRLRELAQRMRRRLNEYGLFPDDPNATTAPQERGIAPIAARTEQEICTALGRWWIPPELREDHGELLAPPPEGLLTQPMIRAELHCHTTASDGALSIVQMVEAALALGYHTIALTDHSRSQAQANGLSIERLREHIEFIRAVARTYEGRIQVLAGSEVDILADGTLDYPDQVLSLLDVVVASPHSALKAAPEVATERLLAAIRHPRVNIIGHPTGRIINAREGLSPDIPMLAREAAAQGVALEVNSNSMRLDLRDIHVRACMDAGCLVAVNTDAHSAADFAQLRYGVSTARRGGLTGERCINTWDAQRLRAWLARERG